MVNMRADGSLSPKPDASISSKVLDRRIAEQPFFHVVLHPWIGKLIATAMAQIDCPAGAMAITLDNIETVIWCVKNSLGLTHLPAPDAERYWDIGLIKSG
jgi:DNA-binding transcriptional LysR family regulator